MPIISDLSYGTETRPTFFGSIIRQQGKSDEPVKVVSGDWSSLPSIVKSWARTQIELCQPDALHIMDGSLDEDKKIKSQLVKSGVLIPLTKYNNCFLARTDPKDVARVESKTVISTANKLETIPQPAEGVQGQLGHWMSPEDLDNKIKELFPGCMKGRTMYMIPYSMGPVGGPLSKNGVELSDSAYVAVNMKIMTRVGTKVLECIKDQGEFTKCLHSVGRPLGPNDKDVTWPCNPAQVLIAHRPATNDIISFGSGYGGNSLMGKKCFALRIGSVLAKKEGWFAEHMLIMGIKRPGESEDKRKYICAAFPSACGKTNLAMLRPTLEGFDTTCVGDDIAWLRFDKDGALRAINPENGFFGVAPGTSDGSNPVAMQSIFNNTIFANVGLTDDGGVWWEGMSKKAPEHLIDWLGKEWTPDCGRPAAHPNSRFCAPAENCPILDKNWEDPKGVKIDAILFGGRRPEGVPLVYEAFNWNHGVFMGASVKSEATAAAEHKSKVVMHDPFSMRPFFGYNFGDYLAHWLSFGRKPALQLPRIFMVNWFRRTPEGGFMWPGYGDNIRVIDWALRRCDGDDKAAVRSPIGFVPAPGSLNIKGLEDKVDLDALFSTPKDYWLQEVDELKTYFSTQVGESLPKEISNQLDQLQKRLETSEK